MLRDELMAEPVTADHENRVLVEPGAALALLLQTAQRRGLATRSVGRINDDVERVVSEYARVLTEAPPGEFCVAGVGEVTVRVRGGGSGGRCQEFALRMGEVLAGLGRPGACVVLATDGRDFIEGVGGAWSDETTPARLAALGVDVHAALERHDAHGALAAVGQLVEGGRTGWNLCDLYVVVLGPARPGRP
jgi:hydroxypyruvate reductase